MDSKRQTKKPGHRPCADCGAPARQFLCERCIALCDALTAAGLYYAYRTGRLRAAALPEGLRPLAEAPPRPRGLAA